MPGIVAVNIGESMMDTTWTKQLSIGNAALDSDHQKLIGMIDHIDHVTKERDSFALLRELQPLNDCLNHHSMKEEQFARALDIHFGMHKVAHQNLQAEIDLTMYELKKNSVGNLFVMDDYAQFLRDCLIRHITEEDMLMEPALKTYPYDYDFKFAQPAVNRLSGSGSSRVRSMHPGAWSAPCGEVNSGEKLAAAISPTTSRALSDRH